MLWQRRVAASSLVPRSRGPVGIRVEARGRNLCLFGSREGPAGPGGTSGMLPCLPEGGPSQPRAYRQLIDRSHRDETCPSENQRTRLKGTQSCFPSQRFPVRLPRRSVFVEELGSNCCRPMPAFSPQRPMGSGGDAGVAVREEVTFANMSRDKAPSVQTQWDLFNEKMKWSFVSDARVCGDRNGTAAGTWPDYLWLPWVEIALPSSNYFQPLPI